MILYAIRHASGEYLAKRDNGSSWWEGEKGKGTLRLFNNLGVAKGWRTTWLKGRVVKEYSRSSPESFYDDEVHLMYEPRPNRTLADISIIPVALSFGDPL